MSRSVGAGRRWARRALRALNRLVGVLLLLMGVVLAALAWLLVSPDGARFAIEVAQRRAGPGLTVDTVSGRLIGPLNLTGLAYDDGRTSVAIQSAALRWQPLALVRGRLRIVSLEVDGVEVALTPAPEPAEPAPQARIPERWPLGLVIRAARVSNFSLRPAPGAVPVVIDSITLSGRWVGSRVRIGSLTVDAAAVGHAELSGGLRLGPTTIEVEELRLAGPAEATLEGRWALTGDSDLRLSWTRLQWPLPAFQAPEPLIASGAGSVRLRGAMDDLRLALEAELTGGARLHGDGRWTASGAAPLAATLSWENLGYPFTEPEAPYRAANGQASVEGRPDDYRFVVETLASAPLPFAAKPAAETTPAYAAAPRLPLLLRVSGQGSLAGATLERLMLSAEGARLEASGQVIWQPAVSASLSGELSGLDPGRFAPGWDGAVNGHFQVQGGLAPSADARFSLTLFDSQLRQKPLSATLAGRWRDDALSLEPGFLAMGTTRLEIRGRAWPSFDLVTTLDSPDLGDLWPTLAGSASLNGRLAGTVEDPRARLDGEIKDAAFAGARLGRATLDADLGLSGPSRLRLTLAELEIGERIEAARLGLDGSLERHRITLATSARQGQASLTLEGGYDRAKQRWNGHWSRGRIEPASLEAWELEAPARLTLDANRARLEQACWHGAVRRLCLEAEREGGAIGGGLSLEDVDLAYFDPLWRPGGRSTGALSGVARVALREGSLERLSVNLASTPGAVTLADGRTVAFGAAEALVQEQGREGVARLRLPFEGGRLALDAGFSTAERWPERRLSGEVVVNIPEIAPLSNLTPEVGSASGRLTARFALGGTIAAPTLDGGARLEDGRVALTTPGIELSGIELRLQSRGLERLDLSGSVTSGTGSLAFGGVVEPGPKLELTLTGQDFLAADLPQARVWVSPDLKLKLADRIAELSGELKLPRAEITPKGLEGGVAPSDDQIIVVPDADPASGSVIAVRSNILVTLGKDVRFTGFGLTAGLTGSLRVFEEPGRTTSARGVIKLAEGVYKAYGQELKIETGRLIHDGGPIDQPALELRATRQPRENIKVGVLVRGTLDAPEFNLFSEPSLPRQEQLSWLILGRPLEQAGGSDDRSLLAGAALSLGVGGSNRLAQNLKDGFGLDDISIGAEAGADTENAMFTVGKYLSPKLYVSYGVGLFLPGHRLKMTYDLGGGFKLSSESGVETGADLLYSWERK